MKVGWKNAQLLTLRGLSKSKTLENLELKSDDGSGS